MQIWCCKCPSHFTAISQSVYVGWANAMFDVVCCYHGYGFRMKRTSLKIVFEIKINSVTCPNIRLDPSKWVHLRLCLLGSYLRSRLLRAQFPLQVDEKIRVERTFPLCSTPKHLYSALTGERISIELVQLYQMGSKVLAIFNTDLNDIIFESPYIVREREIRTEQHTMIMHTTHHFPGIANPYVNATITVRLMKVNDTALEISRDGGCNLTLGLKGSENPYYEAPLQEPSLTSHWSENAHPIRPCQKMAMSRSEPQPKIKPIKRQIFCVRHVDDKLISRTPSSDLFFQNTNHSMTTTPNFPKIRSVKLPLCRSTSHMDTVSSLLRRKPRISQSFYLWEPENEKKYGWGLPDQYQTSESPSQTSNFEGHHHPVDWEYENVHFSPSQDGAQFSQKRDSSSYWVNHNSEICTLCNLYYEYFGQYYPMHTA